MSAKPQIVAIVGLCGAGKSIVAERFVQQGFAYLRFGQITLDEVARRGLQPTEANEKEIREALRKEHGMAAFAILNQPKIDTFLAEGKSVLVDGLYSWSEYKILKEKYGQALTVVAVYAPPEVRYTRLEDRGSRHANDTKMKYRSFTKAEAKARDFSEIENIEKAGPIAMANYTVVNSGTLEELDREVDKVINSINHAV